MLTVPEITNKVFNGDSLSVLKTFPSESVDLVVTSPPYYNLRNYKHENQIGIEKTPKEYITNLINIFRECKRVLKRTGSIWVNISDSYQDNKSLIGIPERFVIAMEDELNLIRRNTIIWHKPSCMPSPVKDRFTVDFDYFYFFTKNPKYKFNTQYEPMKLDSLLRDSRGRNENGDKHYKEFGQPLNAPRLNINKLEYNGKAIKSYKENGVQNPSEIKKRILESMKKKAIKFGGTKYPNQQDSVTNVTYSGNAWVPNENLERIKRTVWSINTSNSPEAHFATYPEELIETPIKACTNKGGDLILDPFLGSGTTAIKAQKMGRNYVGIELNKDYYNIVKRRLNNMISSYILRE